MVITHHQNLKRHVKVIRRIRSLVRQHEMGVKRGTEDRVVKNGVDSDQISEKI